MSQHGVHVFRVKQVLTWAVVIVATAVFWTGRAQALTVTTDLPASWDATVTEEATITACHVTSATYQCNAHSTTRLSVSTENPIACTDVTQNDRIGLQFDLSILPPRARFTKVELITTVGFPTFSPIAIRRASTDAPSQLSCQSAALFQSLANQSTPIYAQGLLWSSTGANTIDLGSQAVLDAQARILGSLALGIVADEEDDYADILASESGANTQPRLRVTYSISPEPSTNLAATATTTSGISWNWIDNAWYETTNDIHNDAHVSLCAAGPASGIGSPISCTESGLEPNTTYRRHAYTVDPDGSAESTSAEATTAIETPAGIAVIGLTSNQIDLSTFGPLSNLQSGFSGVMFYEWSTGRSSGWNQIIQWSMTGLTPNTPYTFQVKARNRLGVETPFGGGLTRYTLPAPPDLTADWAQNSWHNASSINFTNRAGWGPSGANHFRFSWDRLTTHQFFGTEPTWGASAMCGYAPCTLATSTLWLPLTAEGAWYLHVQAFNAEGLANGDQTYGPFFSDQTIPSAPAKLYDGPAKTDQAYSTAPHTLVASWLPGSDGLSGIAGYELAVGTAPNRQDIQRFRFVGNILSTQLTNLSLRDGTTYFVSVRTVDRAGNVSPATVSNGIWINLKRPTIIDRQTGDSNHRRLPGTTYNIDFQKATVGPKLSRAEYIVYSGAKKTGLRVTGWTPIFTTPRTQFTDNWQLNFANVKEGTNYITVRVRSMDGLTQELTDAFMVVKDTTPAPSIKGVVTSTFQRTSGPVTIDVLGRNFRPGMAVWVGSQRARIVMSKSDRWIRIVVPGSQLRLGGHDLRVTNPNGLSFTRTKKIAII